MPIRGYTDEESNVFQFNKEVNMFLASAVDGRQKVYVSVFFKLCQNVIFGTFFSMLVFNIIDRHFLLD